MRARITDRLRLALALLLPTLGGIAYLASFGAPARLIAVNAGALALALAWAVWGRLPARPEARIGLAAAAAGALFLPLLVGPEAGGVSRWLPAGPVQLHAGTLLLPLIAVIAAREPRAGPALLALAGAALALQPDAGSLTGLAAAGAALARAQRSATFALVAIASLALALATWHAGALEPQVYTEGVLAHVSQRSLAGAMALGAALFLATPALLVWRSPAAQAESLALAALLVALGLAAVIAPFPFPLIGYGASPILGFGLALGALAGRAQAAGDSVPDPV